MPAKSSKSAPSAEVASLDGLYSLRPVSELIPYIRNARTHSEAQVKQIAASIIEFGWTNAIMADKDGIVAGHGRVMALDLIAKTGGTVRLVDGRPLPPGMVPVMDCTGWSAAQRRAYIIADNKLAENAGWDMDLLALEMQSLFEEGFDLSLVGFSDKEMANLLAEKTEGLTDEDATPPVPEVPVSVPGDLWVLGKHRVMCGDSTVITDAERLMDGTSADLVFTDPPYNVAYEGRGEVNKMGTIKNDDMTAEQFEDFCRGFFAVFHASMKPLACIYVCHPDSQTAPKLAFEKTFAEHFKKSSTIIWVKQSAGMGWQDYRAQHEPILYGWKEQGRGKHYFCGDRAKTTVWNVGRDAQASYVHPTQKPVALAEEAVLNSSKGQDVVLDLFGGSGSTLIACEKQGRHARLMELDPKYVDVIVQRWQDFTGHAAVLEGDGRTFAEVAGERKGAGDQPTP